MAELPRPIPLTIRGVTLNFYFFCSVQGIPREQLASLSAYLIRMPSQHLAAVARALIVIVPKLGGGRDTGGGFYTSFQNWIGRETRTGIPDAFFAFRSNTEIVAITRNAFNDTVTRPFTFTHEFSHCVHRSFPIYPRGSTLRDYRGIRYTRRPSVEEYAAETYSRYIVAPSRIARLGSIPAGETMRSCTRRLTELLMASPAGQHFRRINHTGPHRAGETLPMPFRYPW